MSSDSVSISQPRVLIVDDSALIRELLTEIFSQSGKLQVVGAAEDPLVARQLIKKLQPDVLTLDVEMPKMDGLTFLGHLMRLHPLPVVMVSSLTESGAKVTLDALEMGAIDFLPKPKFDVGRSLRKYADELVEKVVSASSARPVASSTGTAPDREVPGTAPVGHRLIALGASTGGTEALRHVVSRFPADAPAIVMTQHIPGSFSKAFAARLNASSAIEIAEAVDGQPILKGHGYVAPGDHHLRVTGRPGAWFCKIEAGPRVNRHRPSVDVLMESVARVAGASGIGAILTGMGGDGAKGLLAMREAGAVCVAQDEETSVVWGMPRRAYELNAAEKLLPLDKIAAYLMRAYSSPASKRRRILS